MFKVKALLGLLVCLVSNISIVHAADIVVNTLADDEIVNGNCTLREAILSANSDVGVDSCESGNGADTIYFSVDGTITITSDLPEISDSLSIFGQGVDRISVSGNQPGFGARYRLFDLWNGSSFQPKIYNFRGLRIEYGRATIDTQQPSARNGSGGGIRVRGASMVTLEHVEIANCIADEFGGGGIAIGRDSNVSIRWSQIRGNQSNGVIGGGGIYINGQTEFRMEYSSVIYNHALDPGNDRGYGGGILIAGFSVNGLRETTVDILHSTIASNIGTSAFGGGIYFLASNSDDAVLTLDSSTIVDNRIGLNTADAVAEGGGIYVSGSGLTVISKNTIVARNKDDSDLSSVADDNFFASINSPEVISNGFNFFGNYVGSPSFLPGLPNGNNDYIGVGSLDPKLRPLGDYGGPTQTMPPTSNKQIVDQGSCSDSVIDQRGYGNTQSNGRIVDEDEFDNLDDGCDIGAVEFSSSNNGPSFDFDEDSVVDELDNCVFDQNKNQIDSDEDGYGDVCDFFDDTPEACDFYILPSSNLRSAVICL